MSKHDEASPESLSTDLAFDLLGDRTRREAVAALRESEGAMALGELAATVVARAEGVDPSAVTVDRRERAATRLHHVHLPKLEDASVVAYDPANGEVEARERVEELAPYFEVIETGDGSELD